MLLTIRIFETASYQRGLATATRIVEAETNFQFTLLDCQGLTHKEVWTKICASQGNLFLLNPAMQQYATSETMSYTEVNRFFNSLFIWADQVAVEVDVTPGATDFDTQEVADLWLQFATSDLFLLRHTAGYVDFSADE